VTDKLLAYHREVLPLLEKYMEKDKDGRLIIPSSRYAQFLKELQPLFDKHFGPQSNRGKGGENV